MSGERQKKKAKIKDQREQNRNDTRRKKENEAAARSGKQSLIMQVLEWDASSGAEEAF